MKALALTFEIGCPVCGADVSYVNAAIQSDIQSIGVVDCPEHGEFLVIVRLSRAGTRNVNRHRFPHAGRPKVSAA